MGAFLLFKYIRMFYKNHYQAKSKTLLNHRILSADI